MGAITVPSVKTIAEVTAFPDEVSVVVRAEDGMITPHQARQLAAELIAAADESATLDWLENEAGEFTIVSK